MLLSLLGIIILVTVAFSIRAFKDDELVRKMIFFPFRCKHNHEQYSVFTHLFIHADITHLLFNMLSLYMLGEILEIQLINEFGFMRGEIHFLTLYFLGGIFSTLIPFYRNQDNIHYRSLGASGAVSAIIFAAIIWNPTMQLGLLFLPIPIPAYIFGPLYLLYEYWADKKGKSGIAHDAHIGGALFGILYVLIVDIEKGKEFFNQLFG
jgi:membrane associated rhomboid family serine protease